MFPEWWVDLNLVEYCLTPSNNDVLANYSQARPGYHGKKMELDITQNGTGDIDRTGPAWISGTILWMLKCHLVPNAATLVKDFEFK